MQQSLSQQASAFIKQATDNFKPKVGLILGSGLTPLADKVEKAASLSYQEIPGFGETSVAGHRGELLLGNLNKVPLACLQGRPHYYEGHNNLTMQTPIRTLKALGCEIVILTNAAASLRPEVTPGNIVLIQDHINFQFHNPLVGPNDEHFGPRFPAMQNAYDNELREIAKKTAKDLSIPVSEGVYIGTIGPSYETPAEIRAMRILGGEVVGMSTVPEVILARHCGMKVICFSSITNMGSGMTEEVLTHERVLEVAQSAAKNLSRLIYEFIPKCL